MIYIFHNFIEKKLLTIIKINKNVKKNVAMNDNNIIQELLCETL